MTLWLMLSCSKDSSSGQQGNACSNTTVTVMATVTNAITGQNNGSITANASGGSGFTYAINNGSFQSSNVFTNLGKGNYTITAKNSDGCIGNTQVSISEISPCDNTTITVATTVHTHTECSSPADGSITINATGSTGFSYSIDGINFQSSNMFNNLTGGSKTITVKDVNNCARTVNVIIGPTPAGPLFTAVKNLIQANCETCHNGINPNGINLSIDCNTINNKLKIKARAVDGTPTPMPPAGLLPDAQRQKIIDWISAGGTYAN
jgi:hypothetical protein